MRGVVSVCGNGPVVFSEEFQVSRSVDGPSADEGLRYVRFLLFKSYFSTGWTGPGIPRTSAQCPSHPRTEGHKANKGKPNSLFFRGQSIPHSHIIYWPQRPLQTRFGLATNQKDEWSTIPDHLPDVADALIQSMLLAS